MSLDTDSGPISNIAECRDIAEQITHLLECDTTLKSLRSVSQEWKSLSTCRIKTLKPRSGQRNGALDIRVLAERFPHVEFLDLRTVSGLVYDDSLAPCARFAKLQSLTLDGCKHVTNEGLAQLPTGIKTLSLRHCSQVTLPGLCSLSRLPALTALNIAGIRLTPPGPANPIEEAQPGDDLHPHQLPPAAGASSGSGSGPTSSGLAAVLGRLERLTLGDSTALCFLSDPMLLELLAAARQAGPSRLTALDLSGCIDITDWGVQQVACSLPGLTSLSLQSCVRLSNAGLAELPRLARLRCLNLRGCPQINDDGVAAGLAGLGGLQELNLQGCAGITGSCLRSLAGCPSLASLNVSHCAALSSLEPLQGLAGLQRLAICHCTKLGLQHVSALNQLSRLTELRASHLRSLAPAAAGPVQLASLACLSSLQALDLSYLTLPAGAPAGLMDAVAAMTRLTRLCLAGCAGGGAASSGGGAAPAQGAGAAVEAHVASAAAPGGGLSFLAGLRQLEELDLGAWQEVDPQELARLAGATALRKLVVSRLGNRHSNACFDGCDCASSPASSTCPSAASSAPSSPAASPVKKAATAAPTRLTAAAAAAAAAAFARAEASGSTGGASVGLGCWSTGGASDGACSASDMQVDDQPATARYTPAPASDAAAAAAAETAANPPCALALLRTSSSSVPCTPSLDALSRKMAAVGISCSCGRGCNAANTGTGSTGAAAAEAAALAAVGPAPSAVAAPARPTDPLGAVLATLPAIAAPRPRNNAADPAGLAGLLPQPAHLQSPPAQPQTPPLALPSASAACATSSQSVSRDAALSCAAAAATGLPPLALPLTPRPGLDGALGHLTGLTALTEIHLEACNHLTDVGVSRLALLPRLELLDLGGCARITGRSLGAFATHGSLHTLLLGNCVGLTDAGLAAASRVASLRVLDLSGCGRLGDEGGVTLGSLPRLARLSLRGVSKITDRTVEALTGLASLQWLTLSLCGSITDASLHLLAGPAAASRTHTGGAPCAGGAAAPGCRSLTWLDVSHCWRLSRAGVRGLEAARPQLKVVSSIRP